MKGNICGVQLHYTMEYINSNFYSSSIVFTKWGR